MSASYTNGGVTKDRGTWRMYCDRIDDDGGRKRLTKSSGIKCEQSGNAGKATALRRLREWRSELESQYVVSCDSTVYEYCSAYLDAYVGKPATMMGYRTQLRRISGTSIGSKKVSAVTARDVQAWVTEMRANGLGDVSCAHAHAFLHMVLLSAVENGDIAKSPVKRRTAPHVSRRPVNSLTADGRSSVLARCEDMGTSAFTTAVRIALLTGARRGEICALRWCDIDFDARLLTIEHSMVLGEHGYVMSSPKSTSGTNKIRRVPFGSTLSGYLVQQRELQRQQREEQCLPWDQLLYVCGDPLTGRPYNASRLTRDWSAFARLSCLKGTKGKVPVFHDLRHTYATLAVASKAMDIMSLCSILGHEDPSMTLKIYSDALESAKRRGVDAMEATLETV